MPSKYEESQTTIKQGYITQSSSRYSSQFLSSIPSLAAAIRESKTRGWPHSSTAQLLSEPFAPFYQIQAKSLDAEARAVAHLTCEIAERLRRMDNAYAEWNSFDPTAFFDMSQIQADHLIRVVERFSTVYVVFFVDALLPTFWTAEQFWVERFMPAYHSAHSTHSHADSVDAGSHPGESLPPTSAFQIDYSRSVLPSMIEKWENLLYVSREARRILADHIGYLAVNGSQEERARNRNSWSIPPSPGLPQSLCPDLTLLPTLTLSFEFTLPAVRQRGRLQRLRRNKMHLRNGKT